MPRYGDAIQFIDIEDPNSRMNGHIAGINSEQTIKGFPFYPKTFVLYVEKVPYNEEVHVSRKPIAGDGFDYVYKLLSPQSQVDEIFEYYEAQDTSGSQPSEE